MEFNPSKCEFFIEGHLSSLHTYYINNDPIKEVTFVNYLGIVIGSKLTWKEHTKHVLSKANAALAF